MNPVEEKKDFTAEESRDLVIQTSDEIYALIVKKIEGRSPKNQYLLTVRIVINVFGQFFEMSVTAAGEKQNEAQ